MAAPRRGAPCSPAVGAPSPAHSPAWKQSRAAFALRRRRYVFVCLFVFSGCHWPSQRLRRLGEGDEHRSLTGKIQPFRTPHPISSRHRGSVAEFSRLVAPRKEQRFPYSGLVAGWAQEMRLLPLSPPPPPGERSPRGWTYFLAATPGTAASLAIGGEMGGLALSVMSFVPLLSVRRSLSFRLLSALFFSLNLALKVGEAGF